MTASGTPRPTGAAALLRWQFSLVHRLLDGTFEQLPPALIHQHPPGTAAPAGACYAHAVLSEDLIVNGALAIGRPLALTTWAGRIGLSELPSLAMPISRPLAEPAADWHPWSRRVRLDLPAVRRYARAVYTATDTYLATLPDEVLDPARRELAGCLLNALLLTIATRRGEIAAALAVGRSPDADAGPADAPTSVSPRAAMPSASIVHAASSGAPPGCSPASPAGD
jgi:hypothetical protein